MPLFLGGYMVIQEIILRLTTLNYEYKPEDQDALEFSVEKITRMLLNRTNLDEVPDGLKYIQIDMICADFLKLKKGMGQMTDADLDGVAKAIRMGDTSVEFSDGDTASARFDTAIDYLLNGHEEDIIRYRVMLW